MARAALTPAPGPSYECQHTPLIGHSPMPRAQPDALARCLESRDPGIDPDLRRRIGQSNGARRGSREASHVPTLRLCLARRDGEGKRTLVCDPGNTHIAISILSHARSRIVPGRGRPGGEQGGWWGRVSKPGEYETPLFLPDQRGNRPEPILNRVLVKGFHQEFGYGTRRRGFAPAAEQH